MLYIHMDLCIMEEMNSSVVLISGNWNKAKLECFCNYLIMELLQRTERHQKKSYVQQALWTFNFLHSTQISQC